MTKIYKFGENSFYVSEDSILKSTIKDAISITLLLSLSYINYTYLGNSWYIGLFIVLIVIGFMVRIFQKEISKEELLEELEE